MEILFEDIKRTLGAEAVELTTNDKDVEDAEVERGTGGKDEVKELNQQILVSRDLEVALMGMGLNDDNRAAPESNTGRTRRVSPPVIRQGKGKDCGSQSAGNAPKAFGLGPGGGVEVGS